MEKSKCICTVLLITYNHEPYFKQAIESVLEQETEYKFKIHIFDDASTDGTSDLVREYQQKYPGLITAFIAEENRGAQRNIWAAFRSVDTKYCALLECDDYWCAEDKLQLQIEALEENPECSFCAHNTRTLNKGDKFRKNENKMLFVLNPLFDVDGVIVADDLKLLYQGHINHVNSRVIRMNRVDLDALEDTKEVFLYDNAQFYYLLTQGNMYYINKVMSIYVQTGKGTFSGDDPMRKIRTHINNLMLVNTVTDYKLEKIILEHLSSFIGYWIWLDDIATGMRVLNSGLVTGNGSWFTRFLKAVLPPFVVKILVKLLSPFRRKEIPVKPKERKEKKKKDEDGQSEQNGDK
jgi:glycosyltransferase involved in cell wall biosynthesis